MFSTVTLFFFFYCFYFSSYGLQLTFLFFYLSFFHSHFWNSCLNCDPAKVNYWYKLCQVVCQLYDSLKFEEGRKPKYAYNQNDDENTAFPFLSPSLQIIHVQSVYCWILDRFSISHLVFCHFKSIITGYVRYYCTHNILITEIWKLDDLVKKSLTGEETWAVVGFCKGLQVDNFTIRKRSWN